MRRIADKLWFIGATGVCNLMVWGMFTMLNVPPVEVSAYSVSPSPRIIRQDFVATTGIPVRMVVADLGLDLPIAPGTFDPATDEWTLSDESAYFATSSVPANDSNGATLVYGHAKQNMFEPLKNLSPGMRILIYTDSAKEFTYTFSNAKDVLPTDVSVFDEYGPPRLVLQTCTGPWDAYRALYEFNYEGFRKV